MRAQVSLLQTALKDLNLELEQALEIDPANAAGHARPTGARIDFSSGDDDEGTNALLTPRRLKKQNVQLRRDKQRVSRTSRLWHQTANRVLV